MKATTYTPKFALITLALLGAAAGAPGAHADDVAVGVQTRMVRYADLDLRTDAGAQVLLRRIRVAAEQVCGDVDSRQLDQAAAANACVDKAVAATVRKVDRQALTRMAGVHGYAVQVGYRVASLR